MNPPVVVTLSAVDLARERSNLERGSVVAAGVTGLALGAFCDVELVFPTGEKMTVPARAVLATGAGTVFAFDGHDRQALQRHLAPPAPAAPAPEPGAPVASSASPKDEDVDEEGEPPSASVQDRLRGLSVVEQLRVAREGNLPERVALERLYGKVVWEALLRNNRLSVPEVVRLAKMGTMPRPLLEIIMGNGGWLQVPQIRRGLLSNPRLAPEMIQKLLGLTPREELKLVTQTTAYPPAVRMAAKALLKR